MLTADGAVPIAAAEFASLMDRLGPWPEPGAVAPIAVAVSGGADSLCLALLAAGWAGNRAIPLLALVVDHGLRDRSADEARQTIEKLRRLGVDARLMTLAGLQPGAGLAERARTARYAALTGFCRNNGVVDLLLGHHASDQAETVLMRRRASSGAEGLAGMSPLLETGSVRLLRPLLRIAPTRLRATLRQAGIRWIEDPSNQDRRAQRARVRAELQADAAEAGSLLACAAEAGLARTESRRRAAALIAAKVSIRPEGFALLPPELVPALLLADLVRTIGGRSHRPATDAVERLARAPRAATLAGTRLVPAGRGGRGWLLLREAAALGPFVPAVSGVFWDGRFVLDGAVPDGAGPDDAGLSIGALGNAAAGLRRASSLPSRVLQSLPALWFGNGTLAAVPHLNWTADPRFRGLRFRFQPPVPASESTPFTIL